ncbi:MAG: tetratricopeptide repeat protein [Candidatus Dadabacteria bacterium]|nr:MAG: tetratricopeptide repeat protein [Candidatus Dadabacteria bacterium]
MRRYLFILFLFFTLSLNAEERSDDKCLEAQNLLRSAKTVKGTGEEELNKYLEASRLCPRMVEAWYNAGIVYSELGNREKAVESLNKALSIEKRPIFFIALGNIFVKEGRLSEAEKMYLEALKLEADNVSALQGLGVVKASEGELDKAIEYLRKAARVRDDPITFYNLGKIYEAKGLLSEAITFYEKALNSGGSDIKIKLALAEAYYKSGRNEDSVRVLKGILNEDENNLAAVKLLGSVYLQMKMLERAELAFRKGMRLAPSDIFIRTNLASVLIQKEQPSLAEDVLKGLKGKVSDSKYYSVLGWAQLKLGKYEEAEKNLKKAVELDATNAIAHNNLGVLYQRMGRQREALKEFKTAVRLNPSLEEASENVRLFSQ